MSIVGNGIFEPLREAQEALNEKLDAILTELRSIHLLLESQRTPQATDESIRFPAA